MGLEEELSSSLAQEIAREIDKEILDAVMIDVLTKDEGWIATTINPAFSVNDILFKNYKEDYKADWYAKTAEWVHINATGEYKLLRGQWLFKDPKDATMFILRWS
jgi:hypothetical protein